MRSPRGLFGAVIGLACLAAPAAAPPKAAPPAKPAVCTLTGDTNRPENSTFVPGEAVTLTFTLGGVCTNTPSVNLDIVDENGARVAAASVPVTGGTATFLAPSPRLGYYRVNAALPDGTVPRMLGTRPAGFITYAVVPDPAKRVNYGEELSRFGMQGGFSPYQGSVIPYLGVRYVMGAPAWQALEPKNAGQLAADIAQGRYPDKAPYLDAVTYGGEPWATFEIAQVASAGLPAWAGPLPGTAGSHCTAFGALNPAGVAGITGYATALAREFSTLYPSQSRHYYQVTWEPEIPWCFNGSPKQLNQYYKLVYPVLHAADPKARVMGPTLFYHNDEALLAGMYAAGFGHLIDVFSIHPYAPWPFEGGDFLPRIRAEMAQVNAAAGRKVPFFGTERGLVSGQIGELNQALGNVRQEIALLGEGFIHDYAFYIADFWVNSATETNNTYGYYWNLNPAIIAGTNKLGPKPAVPAYAAMTSMLDGTLSGGALANLTGTQMGYRFTRKGVTILVLWEYQAPSSTVTLVDSGPDVALCNWMGNCSAAPSGSDGIPLTLSASPVYVIGPRLGHIRPNAPAASPSGASKS